jgi:hypothetical protein
VPPQNLIVDALPRPRDRKTKVSQVRFEVFTAMTMKNIVCGSRFNPYGLYSRSPFPHPICFFPPFSSVFLSSDDQSAVTCLPVISYYSPALKMEAIRSSETSVQTRPTRCYIPEDDIFRKSPRFSSARQVCGL